MRYVAQSEMLAATRRVGKAAVERRVPTDPDAE
jgi:hypothetical protein